MNLLENLSATLPSRTVALRLAAAAVVATIFAAPASAQLNEERPQTDVVGIADEAMAENDQVEPDEYSVGVGVTFATDYFFRGYLQDDDGLLNGGIIAQPYIEIGFPVYATDDYTFEATVGTWNSFNSEVEGVGASPSSWYESDLYAGLTASTGNFEFGAIYTWYLYPFGGVPEIQELGAYVSYAIPLTGDDPDVDDEFVFDLGVGAGVYFETKDEGGSEDAYLELGIEAATELEIESFDDPISLAFPVTVGMSLDDYYFDDQGDDTFLGYVSVAAAAGFPLTPGGKYGSWTLTPAVEGLFLFADNLESINGDDNVQLIGSLSLDLAF